MFDRAFVSDMRKAISRNGCSVTFPAVVGDVGLD